MVPGPLPAPSAEPSPEPGTRAITSRTLPSTGPRSDLPTPLHCSAGMPSPRRAPTM